MTAEHLGFLTAAVFAVAFLYSSVGHAGASGYIAVMSLFGLAPGTIKPTALVLNILVASIASLQFARADHLSWRLWWPFAILSVPLAFVGGYLQLPAGVFRVVIGVVLVFSAARLVLRPIEDRETSPPPRRLAIPAGAAIGLLAGLTGTGGGIFLTPLLLFMRWARTKEAAAVSSLFILVNSIAGLLGNFSSTKHIPTVAIALAIAAAIGGAIGSFCGSRRFPAPLLRHLLAVILVIAAVKLISTLGS